MKKEDVIGKRRDELADPVSQDINSPKWQEHQAILASHQAFKNFEYCLDIHRENPIYISISGIPVFDGQGRFNGYRGTGSDVTESYEMSQLLSYQATHDSLTGLINRSEFNTRLQNLLKPDDNVDIQHALCYLDLDRFKVINDSYGHLAGDELLCQLSVKMNHAVRKTDTLARLGGDEFVVLMECCNLDQAQRVASQLLRCVEEFEFVWKQKTLRIAVSIGLMPIDGTMSDAAAILDCADAACYTAKKKGRNRIHTYIDNDQDIVQHHSELRWISQINQALEEDSFVLFAQRVASVRGADKTSIHYEILLRLRDANGELISAGLFLPAAEHYGLSIKIDQWVVCASLNWLKNNPEHAAITETCAINLSGASLADKSFLNFILRELKDAEHLVGKLCFEITETAAITNLTSAKLFINALRNLGCRFSLDDFGSGLSSFSYLKNLPVDYLKIDGSFVRDIAVDPIDKAMVKSINEIGQVMGKQTIAEFVEDGAILDVLKMLQVDYAQGYFIGKPKPLKEFFGEFF